MAQEETIIAAPTALQEKNVESVEAKPVQENKPQKSRSSPAQTDDLMALAERPDEDLLILKMSIGPTTLVDAMLVYEDLDTGKYYVPLTDFVEAIEFPIEVDIENGSADGWFGGQNKEFVLSLKDKKAAVGGKDIPLKTGEIERHEDGIYVTLEVLEKWFPLTLDVNFSELAIEIKSLAPLPIEIRYARDLRRQYVDGSAQTYRAREYPLDVEPPDLFTVPFTNVSMQGAFENAEATTDPFSYRYSALSTGILLGQDAEFSINGTTAGSEPPDMRFHLSRISPEGALLGPLNVTEYNIGDTTSHNIDLIARSKAGRGGFISNMAPDAGNSTRTNMTTIRGELPTGYQVDIMRNGELLDFIEEPDENGEYVFDDLVALPGLNVFELVFYGPQGQNRTEEKRVFIPYNPVEKGEFGYRISTIQDDTNLLTNRRDDTDPDVGEVRSTIETQYGLTDTTAMFAALSSYSMDGKRKTYGLLGSSFSFKGIRTDFNVARANEGGNAYSANAQSTFKGFRWQLGHKIFRKFTSEETTRIALPGTPESETNLSLAGLLPFKLFSSIPASLRLDRFTDDQNNQRTELKARATQNIKKIRLTTEYEHIAQTDRDDNSNLNFQVSSRFNKLFLRGQAQYTLSPERDLQSISLTGDWKKDELTTFRLGFSRSGVDDPLHTLTAGISRDIGIADIGFNVTANDRDEVYALVSAGFALGYNPRKNSAYMTSERLANTGAIAARAFLDHNNNAVFDEDDEPLAGVNFAGDGLDPNNETDENGYVYLDNMRTYSRSTIELNASTLSDPFMLPTVDTRDHILRPSQVLVRDYPVIETGEIDGEVHIVKGTRKKPGSGFIVQLVEQESAEIKQEVVSEYDGFTLFQRVPLGSYTARIKPEQVTELHYCSPDTRTVTLTSEEIFATLPPFIMKPQLDGQDGEYGLTLAQNVEASVIAETYKNIIVDHPEIFEGKDALAFITETPEIQESNTIQTTDSDDDAESALAPKYTLTVGPFEDTSLIQELCDGKTPVSPDILRICQATSWEICPDSPYEQAEKISKPFLEDSLDDSPSEQEEAATAAKDQNREQIPAS